MQETTGSAIVAFFSKYLSHESICCLCGGHPPCFPFGDPFLLCTDTKIPFVDHQSNYLTHCLSFG